MSRNQSFGFGVRVLVKGAWGFAASGKVTPEEVRRITQQAVEVAQSQLRLPTQTGPACVRSKGGHKLEERL